MKQTTNQKHLSDALLILWAGGAALLSYSLVYALRKPYTAASFEGLTFMGSDYKVAVTTIPDFRICHCQVFWNEKLYRN